MNHKSFVFFDCECANTFDGIGKICSFGYVITDDDLNVIESEDVVINPECEFDWYLFSGKGECRLAYSKDYFRIKPNFDSYYKDIKKLLTTGNRYFAGFAVGNDVGFINSACERYSKDYIQLYAFDLQKYLEKKYRKQQKLIEWATEFGINVVKFQTHKSVDDAMLTMLCLKAECQNSGLSAEQIFTSYKQMCVSSKQMIEQAEKKAYRKETLDKIKRLYGKTSPKPKYKSVINQKFAFSTNLFNDIDLAFDLIRQIYDNGGTVYEHLIGEGSIICMSQPSQEYIKRNKEKGVKIILLKELNLVLK